MCSPVQSWSYPCQTFWSKQNTGISLLWILLAQSLIIKTCHQAVNVSTTEAKLFTIRYSINQAISIPHIKCIVVITDSLHTVKKIFNLLLHLYQIHSAIITRELREFFNKYMNNYIKFWNCPSKENWWPHLAVDKNTKSFKASVYFSCKSSWDFSKKCFCDNIVS